MIDVRANIYTRVYIYTRANHNYIVARLDIIIDVRAPIYGRARQYIDVAPHSAPRCSSHMDEPLGTQQSLLVRFVISPVRY